MYKSITISGNLKHLLGVLGVNQRFLANKLQISEQTVSTWVTGEHVPQPSRIGQLCDFFNDRLKNDFGEITPERLKFEDLSSFKANPNRLEDRLRPITAIEPPPKYEGREADEGQLTQGLRDLLEDHKTSALMRITEEEIQVLRGIRFIDHRFVPSKQFYIDALFDYRKSKEDWK